MTNLLLSGLCILMVLSGCGWDGEPTRNNDFTPLTSIEIVAGSSTIAAKTSATFKVNGTYSGQFTRDITNQVVWSSDSPAVAGFVTTANPNRITGKSSGTAIVTATVGSVSSTFRLTVSAATVTTLTITPATSSLSKGRTVQYAVRGLFSDTTTQDLTFDAAWTSSDSGVATVSDAIGSKGLTKAISVGTATISTAFGGITGTQQLTVTEPVLNSITVSPVNPSVLTLSSQTFKATGIYTDGSTADITAQVAWDSSRKDVATISSSGTAATLTQGTTAISAALSGIAGTSNLKTTGGNLAAIAISPNVVTLVKDTVSRLTATGTFSDGSIRDITSQVSWSPASATIATVTTPGGNLAWLNALAATPAGTLSVITVKNGSISTTTSLIVTIPSVTSIVITPVAVESLTVGTGNRQALTAYFSDGTKQEVTASSEWSSSNTAAATVGNSGIVRGRVSGVAAGTTIISAKYGGMTVTAPVTVTARTLNNLVITDNTVLTSGNQVKFTATAGYTDGSTVDVTEDTTWVIDFPNVAILIDSQNLPGQVVAVDHGTATLTASFGGKTKTATISVP